MQFVWLLWRSLLAEIRDPFALRISTIQTIVNISLLQNFARFRTILNRIKVCSLELRSIFLKFFIQVHCCSMWPHLLTTQL